MLNIRAVQHRGAYRLWVQFNDGTEGEIDLASLLPGGGVRPAARSHAFRGSARGSRHSDDRVAEWRGLRTRVLACTPRVRRPRVTVTAAADRSSWCLPQRRGEALAAAALRDLLDRQEAGFEAAANHVVAKNAELYRLA